MNRLINNDTDLRRYIPNQVVAVKGEASLFDKIAYWLDTAEQWIFATFCPESVIDAILADKSYSALHASLAAIAAHRALADAIPSLDLVQTVNGFAVVSNQNLAPASRDRVDRLIAAHRSQCDTAISALIPLLATVPQWRDTLQCGFFRSTLFPTPAHIRPIASGATTWERYEELHPAIVAAEDRLAAEYISHNLMQRLRDETLGLSPLSGIDARLCEAPAPTSPTSYRQTPARHRPPRYCRLYPATPRHLPRMAPLRHRPAFFATRVPQQQAISRILVLRRTADNPGRCLPDAFAGYNEQWRYGTAHRFSVQS